MALTLDQIRDQELSDDRLQRTDSGKPTENFERLDDQNSSRAFEDYLAGLQETKESWLEEGEKDLAERYEDQLEIERSAVAMDRLLPNKFDTQLSQEDQTKYSALESNYENAQERVLDRDFRQVAVARENQRGQSVNSDELSLATENTPSQVPSQSSLGVPSEFPAQSQSTAARPMSDRDYQDVAKYKVGDMLSIESNPHRDPITQRPTSTLSRGDIVQVVDIQDDRLIVSRNGKEIPFNVQSDGDRVKMMGNEPLKQEQSLATTQDAQKPQSQAWGRPGLVSSEEMKAMYAKENKQSDVKVQPVKAHDIDGYKAQASAGKVDYEDVRTSKVAFTDTGSRIRVADSRDNQALAASLKLASEKYESFSIKGSQETKEKIAAEAVKQGLGDRIKNPEMKAYIADLQSKELRSPEQQTTVKENARSESPLQTKNDALRASGMAETPTKQNLASDPVIAQRSTEMAGQHSPIPQAEAPTSKPNAASERHAARLAEIQKQGPVEVSASTKSQFAAMREARQKPEEAKQVNKQEEKLSQSL